MCTSNARAIPAPSITLPLDRWSSVISSFASFHGLLLGIGVTIGPNLILFVVAAIAARVVIASATGMPLPVSSMWSQMKKPSHPAVSASFASSVRYLGSEYSPNVGQYNPNFNSSLSPYNKNIIPNNFILTSP